MYPIAVFVSAVKQILEQAQRHTPVALPQSKESTKKARMTPEEVDASIISAELIKLSNFFNNKLQYETRAKYIEKHAILFANEASSIPEEKVKVIYQEIEARVADDMQTVLLMGVLYFKRLLTLSPLPDDLANNPMLYFSACSLLAYKSHFSQKILNINLTASLALNNEDFKKAEKCIFSLFIKQNKNMFGASVEQLDEVKKDLSIYHSVETNNHNPCSKPNTDSYNIKIFQRNLENATMKILTSRDIAETLTSSYSSIVDMINDLKNLGIIKKIFLNQPFAAPAEDANDEFLDLAISIITQNFEVCTYRWESENYTTTLNIGDLLKNLLDTVRSSEKLLLDQNHLLQNHFQTSHELSNPPVVISLNAENLRKKYQQLHKQLILSLAKHMFKANRKLPVKLQEQCFTSFIQNSNTKLFACEIKKITPPSLTSIANTWILNDALNESFKTFDNLFKIIELLKNPRAILEHTDKPWRYFKTTVEKCGEMFFAVLRTKIFHITTNITLVDTKKETIKSFLKEMKILKEKLENGELQYHKTMNEYDKTNQYYHAQVINSYFDTIINQVEWMKSQLEPNATVGSLITPLHNAHINVNEGIETCDGNSARRIVSSFLQIHLREMK